MAQGRGGAGKAMANVLALLLLMLLQSDLADSRNPLTYRVGGNLGWTFGFGVNWSGKKSLCVDDLLDFTYDASKHNVAVVDQPNYDMCTVPIGAEIFSSGHELLKLKVGPNYFICDFQNNCGEGMKLEVNAVICP